LEKIPTKEVIMEIKEFGENSIGKSIQAGRHCITKQYIKSFKKWVDDFFSFQQLSKTDKRILFLRWKWGFSSNETNEALEVTRRGMIDRIKMLIDSPQEDTKYMVNDIVNFESYCYTTMGEIGLVGIEEKEWV